MKLDDKQLVELKRFILKTVIDIGITEDKFLKQNMERLREEVKYYIQRTIQCFMPDVEVNGTLITVRIDNRMDCYKYVIDVSDYNLIFNYDEFIEQRLTSFNI